MEKGYTGRQVQLAHMKLARRKRQWPVFSLPPERGEMTATEVLHATPGADRDRAIDRWCVSVWNAFRGNRDPIVQLLKGEIPCS